MITRENREEYMMMLADGELSPSETAELKAFVKGDPALEQELAYWMAARIVPDAREVYTGKEELLKKTGGTRIIGIQWNRSYGIAAGILLLICLGLFRWQGSNYNSNQVVVNDTAKHFQNQPFENPRPATTVVASSADTNSKEAPIAEQENKMTKKELASSQNITPHPTDTKKDEPIARKETQKAKPAADNSKVIAPKRPVKRFGWREEKVKEPIAKKETLKGENKEGDKLLAKTHKDTTEEERPEKFGWREETVNGPDTSKVAIPEDSISAVTKPKKNFFARLAFAHKKNAGIGLVNDVIADKVKRVNRVKENLKNTDITIKIGNKELFAFNL